MKWNDTIITNCDACTFPLENGSVLCEMCGSKSTHQWRYIGNDGDTTYETPYTLHTVIRNREIIHKSCNDILENKYNQIFCAIRPPGHHSCKERRAGFCHFNYAIEALDIFHRNGKRAVIFDIDAHYGDGTEDEILKRSYGYFISIHGYGLNVYPKGRGKTQKTERLMSEGLPADAGDDIWLKSFWKCYEEIQSGRFDVVIVSCGLDGLATDVMAPLKLTFEPYRIFGEVFKNMNCLYVLEGGYDIVNMPKAVSMLLVGSISTS
jgi:acetoin utilization deacetylase AcuC-like enzyme